MSCGGNMMRAGQQPLAHLVDAAALRWLAAESASVEEQQATRDEITGLFGLGDRAEITYHGLHYLLTISRALTEDMPAPVSIDVHKIAQPE